MSFGTSEQESRREYDDTDVALVEEFARRVSTAIDNARLFRQADELNRLKDEFLATLHTNCGRRCSADPRMVAHAGRQAARRRARGTGGRGDRAQRAGAVATSSTTFWMSLVAMAGNLRLDVKPVDLVAVAHRGRRSDCAGGGGQAARRQP